MRSLLAWIAPLVALLPIACAESSSRVELKYASDFRPGSTTVSVFGTFRNGQMDPEFGALLAPAINTAFGPGRCEVAYGSELSRRDPELYAALGEQAKAEGVSDELLEKVAPMSQGELLLVVSVHGVAAPRSFGGVELDPTRMGPQASSRGAPRSRVPPAGSLRRIGSAGGLVITASFYAVRFHRAVARMSMTYEGPSAEDAATHFATELAKVVPGSTCKGFRWGNER